MKLNTHSVNTATNNISKETYTDKQRGKKANICVITLRRLSPHGTNTARTLTHAKTHQTNLSIASTQGCRLNEEMIILKHHRVTQLEHYSAAFIN